MGILGAEQLGAALRGTSWDFVVCSDLLRTRRTWSIIQAQRTQPLIDIEESFNPAVREVNFGVREGLPKDTSVDEAKRIWSQKRGVALEAVTDPAESEAAVLARQQAFLAELRHLLSPRHARSALPDSNPADPDVRPPPAKVLCVSHGGFIRRFLANFTDVQVESIPNCSITTIDMVFSGEVGNSDGSPSCRAMDVCQSGHLRPPPTPSSGWALSRDESGSVAVAAAPSVEEYLWPS
jgi:broad specificity phosphatase PhoE